MLPADFGPFQFDPATLHWTNLSTATTGPTPAELWCGLHAAFEGSLLSLCPSSGKLVVYTLNLSNLTWHTKQLDLQVSFLSKEGAVLGSKLYFIASGRSWVSEHLHLYQRKLVPSTEMVFARDGLGVLKEGAHT